MWYVYATYRLGFIRIFTIIYKGIYVLNLSQRELLLGMDDKLPSISFSIRYQIIVVGIPMLIFGARTKI